MFVSNKKQNPGVKRLAITGGIAAAAGYVAGTLLAPKSGKETRKDIREAAKRRQADAEKELKRLQVELDKVMQQAKKQGNNLSAKAQKELNVLVAKTKESKEKTQEIIGAIRKGDAEDQDLKRAIKNAQASIDHLKDYLKK